MKKALPLVLICVSVIAGIFFHLYPKITPYFKMVAKDEVYREEFSALDKELKKTYPEAKSAIDQKTMERLFEDRVKKNKVS
ncbi:MAG TPA: hypothetical protein PLU24_03245, partial [Candidatus Omnitrophota bacterium]|nr:hypothetical protein [Candidatus Omnitrophota bacterium]